MRPRAGPSPGAEGDDRMAATDAGPQQRGLIPRRLAARLRGSSRILRSQARLWVVTKRILVQWLPQRLYARALIIVIARLKISE